MRYFGRVPSSGASSCLYLFLDLHALAGVGLTPFPDNPEQCRPGLAARLRGQPFGFAVALDGEAQTQMDKVRGNPYGLLCSVGVENLRGVTAYIYFKPQSHDRDI